MGKDNSVQNDLQIQLKQALENKETEEVYRLHKAGANLEEFAIIGISNISGEWSDNVAKSAQAFGNQNLGVYYLPMNSIEQVKDDSFIKHFSGLMNPGAADSFPSDRSFQLSDLDSKNMLDNEFLYQAIIDQSNKFHIPYLGICSGSQHLVLNNKGFLKREPGYIGGGHKANFIYGTIPYFMTLTPQEQEQALTECILPEISFPVYTAHNYAAEKDKLGGVKLGAVSEEGVVEAHSRGTTQIGVQFHPENYYFDTDYPINRQKQFLDNFFGLCKRHSEILKYAVEHNLSEQAMHSRMEAYDLAILSNLQSCSNKGISPAPLQQIPLLDGYDTCLNPVPLAKESYNQIIEGKIGYHLNNMDFSNQQLKYSALRAIEDKNTLQQFLQLDKQPQAAQKSFIELEEALQSHDKGDSFIAQKFLGLLDTKSDLGQYAFIRVMKSQRIDLAVEIIDKNPKIISSISFKRAGKAIRWKIVDNLVQKGRIEQALEVIKTIAAPELAIFEAIKENKQEVFKELLAIIVTDQGKLGNALAKAVEYNRLDMFDKLFLEVIDPDKLGNALYASVEYNRTDIFDRLLPKITDQYQFGHAFSESVKHKRLDVFNKLWSKITDQNQLSHALLTSIKYNCSDMFDKLLPKVTDQEQLGNAFVEAIENNRSDMFDKLLPKVTDQDQLGTGWGVAVHFNRSYMCDKVFPKVTDPIELANLLVWAAHLNHSDIFDNMFDKLLLKITDQDQLGNAFVVSVAHNRSDMFDKLLLKITDQDKLGNAFSTSIEHNRLEMFNQLLPKITDQAVLGQALKTASTFSVGQDIITSINQRIFSLKYPLLSQAAQSVGDGLKQANDAIKQYDSFKLLGGANALPIDNLNPDAQLPKTSIATSIHSPTTSDFTSHTAIAAPSDTQNHNRNQVLANQGMSAEQINQNLSTGIAAFAFVMKSLGYSTDWLMPALGESKTKAKMNSLPETLSADPQYDYIAKIEEMAKKASPIQQAAFREINEKAKTGETKDWSKEDWQKFMKDNHKFNAFIDVMELEAKKASASARPLTQKDIEDTKEQRDQKRKQSSKSVRFSK